ncbi:MAG: hypothetical protein HYZ53_27815 [Planctomycetes bacterium]|nr:hypothetical protein [Planctomycetota bacterium]
MASAAEELFCKIAIEKCYLDANQAAAALRRPAPSGKGILRPLHERLCADGVLSAEQAAEVLRERDYRLLREEDQRWVEKALRNRQTTMDLVNAAMDEQARLFRQEKQVPPPLSQLLRGGGTMRSKKRSAGLAQAEGPPVASAPTADEAASEASPGGRADGSAAGAGGACASPEATVGSGAPGAGGKVVDGAGSGPGEAGSPPPVPRRSFLAAVADGWRAFVDDLRPDPATARRLLSYVVAGLLVAGIAWLSRAMWFRLEGEGPPPPRRGAAGAGLPGVPASPDGTAGGGEAGGAGTPNADHSTPRAPLPSLSPCIVLTFPPQPHPLSPDRLTDVLEAVVVVHLSQDKLEPIRIDYDLRVRRTVSQAASDGTAAGSRASPAIELKAGEWYGRRESYDLDVRQNCHVGEEGKGRFWLCNWLRSRSSRLDEFGRPLELWAACAILRGPDQPVDAREASFLDIVGLRDLRIEPQGGKAWLTETGANGALVKREGKAVFVPGDEIEARWSPARMEAARKRKARRGQVAYLIEVADSMTTAGDLEAAVNRLTEAEALSDEPEKIRVTKARIEEARKAREAAARQAQALVLRKEALVRVEQAKEMFRRGDVRQARARLGHMPDEAAELIREENVVGALTQGWAAFRDGDAATAGGLFFTAALLEPQEGAVFHEEALLGQNAVRENYVPGAALLLADVAGRPLDWKRRLLAAAGHITVAWRWASPMANETAFEHMVREITEGLEALNELSTDGGGSPGKSVLALRGLGYFLLGWARAGWARCAEDMGRPSARLGGSAGFQWGRSADACGSASSALVELRKLCPNEPALQLLPALNTLLLDHKDPAAARNQVQKVLAGNAPRSSFDHELFEFGRWMAEQAKR